jgi:hypothetical protein
MFSNGKFKNVVASVNSRQDCPINPGSSVRHSYTLYPTKGSTKNWIALEDSYSRAGANLASTVARGQSAVASMPPLPSNGGTTGSNDPERNVFAIFVTYYCKVKLIVGAMNSEVSVKLPFTLLPSEEKDTGEIIPPEAPPPLVAIQPKIETSPKPHEENGTEVKAVAAPQRPAKIGATAVGVDTIEPSGESSCWSQDETCCCCWDWELSLYWFFGTLCAAPTPNEGWGIEKSCFFLEKYGVKGFNYYLSNFIFME